ncbi:MAG: hypothetical protein KAH30_00205 [Caldisericia bacterium]|nr:hypothetical protein [Caldisericia bacterium]
MNKNIKTIVIVVVCVAVVGLLAMKIFNKQEIFPIPLEGEVTIIEVGADLCIPCQKLTPILEEIKIELEGKATLHKIILKNGSNVKDFYDVSIIPVIIIYDQEANEVTRRIFSENDVNETREWIRYHINELGVVW